MSNSNLQRVKLKPAMSSLESPDPTQPKPHPRWYQRVAAGLGLGSGESLRQTLERAIEEPTQANGDFSPQERTMLLNTLRFGALRVSDVMVPRADIVAVAEDEPVAELLKLFAEAGHSRLPVYRESLDDPLGMVHIKDLTAWLAAQATLSPKTNGSGESSGGLELGKVDMSAAIAEAGIRREVLFVPPSMPVVDLLLRMQATHIHLAIVVDEFGGTDGLVSIEDLVEEIVGDIEDEHDIDELPPIRREGSTLIASARTPIEDVERALGVNLLDAETEDEGDTLGGLLFAMAGRIPPKGQVIAHPAGVNFQILEATPRRINRVRISGSAIGEGGAPPQREADARIASSAPQPPAPREAGEPAKTKAEAA
jgi:CBS domain containing-hemolysin-like protein